MQPNANQQPIGDPVSLPQVAVSSQPAAGVPAYQASSGSLGSVPGSGASVGINTIVEQQGVAQVKQAVAQYGDDPYKLAAAFGQLKAGYLSSQYHITSNQAGN